MGTKVHCESLYHSMRDLNNESNSCTVPLFYNSFPPQTEKEVVRRTMLEHEAVFKTQVLELHRVYRLQKDTMNDLKRKQLNTEASCIPIEASCSSQATNDDVLKWKIPSFPLGNSVYDKPSMSVVEDNGHSQGLHRPVSWQNGASSKTVDMSEVRPTKIRKKMIDLCLPADEYIDDTEEVVELKDHRVCGTLSQLPNGNVKSGYELSRSNGLADLNQPFKDQETNEFAYSHPRELRIGEFEGHTRDHRKSLNSGSVREHSPVIPLHPHENGKPKFWPHQPLRNLPFVDHYNGTYNSATSFLQPAKPLDSLSQPNQVFMNGTQRVMGLPNFGPPSKADFWRGKTFIDLEADTDTNSTNEVIHESSLASHEPRQSYPCNPQDSPFPWNRSHWQDPRFSFPQKVASAQRYPVLNLSETLTGSAQKQECLGDRLQFESNSRFNSGYQNNTIRSNHMFYNDCSSSSKSKFSGTSYGYPNGGRNDYSLANPFMGSEKKFVRDLNLNVTLPNTSVAEVRKREEHLANTLPWLVSSKPACNSEVADAKLNVKTNDDAGNKVQNHIWLETLKSGSCSNKCETEKIIAKTKISGFGYRDESSAKEGKVHSSRMLDINEPCDPLLDEDQETVTKVSVSNRCHIDLNMSVSEDEDENLSLPTSLRLNSKTVMIDLETIPGSDVEEDDIYGEKQLEEAPIKEKTSETPHELEKIAGETIVAISSACLDREIEVVASSETILHWFAETVENLDKKLDTFLSIQADFIEEIDYFESMTLKLPELTEDEYMPTPLVPEDFKFEETSGTGLVTSQRPRRGNARKAKQRRDFQRDILPGLLSLSKHEVTEDIHMFDGFMRATGSSWTPTGLAKKKTGTRGRPRRVIPIPEPAYSLAPTQSVQHVSNQSKNGEVEMGVEDRSFATWGKMKTRPRRQRCPSTVSNQRSSSHTPFS